jgi:hypothetical protein
VWHQQHAVLLARVALVVVVVHQQRAGEVQAQPR